MKIDEKEFQQQVQLALTSARTRLLKEMNATGFWEGSLSSSPLATAVAVFALAQVDQQLYAAHIRKGLAWLAESINNDSGWGDSPRSRTNLSTTLLCWSAFSLTNDHPLVIKRVEFWLQQRIGCLTPEAIAAAVLKYYGNDRTFSAPILLMCALAGRLGKTSDCWRHVPQLPLELATLPHRLFKWLRLPVVSYAVPALIAIGLARHRQTSASMKPVRLLRELITMRVLDKLFQIQPQNGGFLEAAPLTGFVVMSLAASGLKSHPIVTRGVRFLVQSQRDDGSWPIDTNLATWVTTLSVNAFAANGAMPNSLTTRQRDSIRDWLLQQQLTEEHAFTHAAPGGWSWTNLPGGVPDADDTSGVLLALHHLGATDSRTAGAAISGIRWLLELQNRDGGFPTFCKGWGRLPFDRSCPDITAHALRAFAAWHDDLPTAWQTLLEKPIQHGLRYLATTQRPDGSWLPLWFGNQWAPNGENPTYGTAQVVNALRHEKLRHLRDTATILEKGRFWLIAAQNADGGWGSNRGIESTIEETALALSTLAGLQNDETINRGARWLIKKTASNDELLPTPIGLYFASLWYDEKLYPIIFTVAALETIVNQE